MSSIIIDLEEEALRSNVDIIALLRKSKVISHKLQLQEFEEWTNNELNGYGGKKIPDYRYLHGELKAWNPYYGWIPVIGDGSLDILKSLPSSESISELVELAKSRDRFITICFGDTINSKLNECVDSFLKTKYALLVGTHQISAIIERVKNLILEWTLKLEDGGILGEGLKFNNKEKDIAINDSSIKNYVMNFYGNVTDTQIQTDTNSSKQVQRVKVSMSEV